MCQKVTNLELSQVPNKPDIFLEITSGIIEHNRYRNFKGGGKWSFKFGRSVGILAHAFSPTVGLFREIRQNKSEDWYLGFDGNESENKISYFVGVSSRNLGCFRFKPF